MANESIHVTLRHIARVRELLGMFAIEMIRRGDVHDASKFDPVEQGPLDEMQRLIDAEGQAPYGTPEYKRRTALLGPMLEHHYANNSHPSSTVQIIRTAPAWPAWTSSIWSRCGATGRLPASAGEKVP